MNTFGISLYLGTGMEKNAEVLKKAQAANIRYAFTSLHIPEEHAEDYGRDIQELLSMCKSAGIVLITDIGPRTLQKLGCRSLSDLKGTAISYLRVDYGFTCREMVELSRDFHLVVNASTFQKEQIYELQALHADFSRFSACHNFYPKPLTGLSLQKVEKINTRMHQLGMQTIAFVAGNQTLRGPLHKGLPTVEEQRSGDVLLHMLQLMQQGDTDICMVGDVDISDHAYTQIKELSEGYVTLKAKIHPEYRFIADSVHHDRPDSSEFVIRSQESRTYESQGKLFSAEPCCQRKKGSISIGNERYLRYSGELEIARMNLEPEEKVNIIGQVCPESLPYLAYIQDGMGFRLIYE